MPPERIEPERACRVCGEVRSIAAFRRRRWVCTPCEYAQNNARQKLNRPAANARNQRYYRRDVERSRAMKREQARRTPGTATERARRFKADHPEKAAAHRTVRLAVRAGRLAKPSTCERCGAAPPPKRLHAHHTDYARPLIVEWLCTVCHRAEHAPALAAHG